MSTLVRSLVLSSVIGLLSQPVAHARQTSSEPPKPQPRSDRNGPPVDWTPHERLVRELRPMMRINDEHNLGRSDHGMGAHVHERFFITREGLKQRNEQGD